MTTSLHTQAFIKLPPSLLILALSSNLAYAHTGAGDASGLLGMATGMNKIGRPQWLRWAGAAVALCGGALFFAG